MTTVEKPPEWTVPAEFAARWGVAASDLVGDGGRVAGLVFTDTRPVVRQTQPSVQLSVRHQQVLRLIADGLTNVEIGAELGVSEHTAKSHARGLFRRLKANDRAHAVALGFRTGCLV